jgi:hypothetical protein
VPTVTDPPTDRVFPDITYASEEVAAAGTAVRLSVTVPIVTGSAVTGEFETVETCPPTLRTVFPALSVESAIVVWELSDPTVMVLPIANVCEETTNCTTDEEVIGVKILVPTTTGVVTGLFVLDVEVGVLSIEASRLDGLFATIVAAIGADVSPLALELEL